MKNKYLLGIVVLACFSVISGCETAGDFTHEFKKDFNAAYKEVSGMITGVMPKSSREKAVKKYNYKGDSKFVKIESSRVSPKTIARGGRLNSEVTMAVLLPNKGEHVSLEARRILKYGDEVLPLGKPIVKTMPQGTFKLTSSFVFPKDADVGNYTLIIKIKTKGIKKQVSNKVKLM